MTRLFIWLTSAIFVGFGIWGLFDPVAMVAEFGIELQDPNGKTFIRASYGGFLIGAGILFGWCAAAPDRLRFGLVAVITLTLPILISRLIGLAIDGWQSAYHLTYIGIELVGVVVGSALLLKAARE